ncbi:MAG: KOW domain-containing RNA-binding protein [Firmicutes bacterium]|nr:KOW domain-containing RNA-binding protein [Bacillota bacterium]
MFEKGQIVFSKAGHDKGQAFIVVSAEGQYAYIADGRGRKLQNPKKKKYKHIQISKYILEDIKEKLESGGYLTDADIRKALSGYVKNTDLKPEL